MKYRMKSARTVPHAGFGASATTRMFLILRFTQNRSDRYTSDMPATPLRWRHVIVNTKSSWLHGDPRGFRTRGHRIHSSGDYKNLPPPGEHAKLHQFMKSRAAEQVVIPVPLRIPILKAIVERMMKEGFEVRVASVADKHAHALVELPDDRSVIREIIGRCKRAACCAVATELPGSIWSTGGTFEPVDSPSHLLRAYHYIYEKQGPSAATWNYNDGVYRPPRDDPGRR